MLFFFFFAFHYHLNTTFPSAECLTTKTLTTLQKVSVVQHLLLFRLAGSKLRVQVL